MGGSNAATAAATPEGVPGLWKRFLGPYYVCNAVALLMYLPIRYEHNSDALQKRDYYLNIPLEQEIFLLALASWLLNYRKKATADGVVALLFMYGKVAVLAALYYLDTTFFGWYGAYCLVLFVAVGQPKYDGPSKMLELNPALVEKLVKPSVAEPSSSCKGGKRSKAPPSNSWLVYYHVDWSDFCLEHDPMLADISVRYTSETLRFGKVDLNKWPDLAVENGIDVSATSWQLPTLILFQDGKEAMRLPPVDAEGNVTKTILDKPGVITVFKLQDLMEGKEATFKAKSS